MGKITKLIITSFLLIVIASGCSGKDEGDTSIKESPENIVEEKYKFYSDPVDESKLSEEQKEQLTELEKEEKDHSGIFPYKKALVLGLTKTYEHRLSCEEVKEISDNYSDEGLERILEEILNKQPYPDCIIESDRTTTMLFCYEEILNFTEENYKNALYKSISITIYPDRKGIISCDRGTLYRSPTTLQNNCKFYSDPVDESKLSEEQKEQLAVLEREESTFAGIFPYKKALILGITKPYEHRLTGEELKEIVEKNKSGGYRQILDKILEVQPYPDYIGGSGITSMRFLCNEDTDFLNNINGIFEKECIFIFPGDYGYEGTIYFGEEVLYKPTK